MRNNKKVKAETFNKENEDIKICILCNNVVEIKNINIDTIKCIECYNKCKLSNKIRNPRDKVKAKLYNYKRSAKNRGLVFELTDEEVYKILQLSCNYCGIIDNDVLGIDRIDSNIGYTKKNSVPCCEQCNLMKHVRNQTEFINICEHISTINKLYNGDKYFELFIIPKTGRYISYKQTAEKRNIDFEITKDEFRNIISKNCFYCNSNGVGYYGIGAGGIDRVNSAKSYNLDNCVPCCTTCNIMKLNYTKEAFINKCLMITKYQSKNKNLEEEIITFFEKYSENKNGINRTNPTFFHSKDFYEHRKWNGNLDDVKNIDISLEFVENSDQKDLWNYYRWTISSLNTYKPNNFIGRVICVLIKDKTTNKYLGIMSLSSDILNMEARDEKIGWSMDEKINNKKINLIANLSTCVSIQPFGFNFNGGKLIAKLAFSKEIMDEYERKFNNKLLAIVTTGLYGKSVQYDRLQELKEIGMTKGNSVFWIPEEITQKCREYLKKVHNINTNNYKKLDVISKIITILGLDKEEIMKSNCKGVYFGFTRSDSKDFLCGNSTKINSHIFKTAKEILDDWYNRWCINRFTHLGETNRIKEITIIKSTERVKRYHEKLKKDLGEKKYKEMIKDNNEKTYNNKKEKMKELNVLSLDLSPIINEEKIKSTEKVKKYRENLKNKLGEEKYKELVSEKNKKTYNNKKELNVSPSLQIYEQNNTNEEKIKSTEKVKKYRENLKNKLGEEKYNELISEKNKKTYNNKKELNVSSTLQIYEQNNTNKEKIKSTEKVKKYLENLKNKLGEEKYKELISEKNKKTYNTMKEKLQSSQDLSHTIKKEKISSTERVKKHYEKLKEELGEETYNTIIKEKKHEYYEKNKEKSREYYQKNKEKILEKYNKTKKIENSKINNFIDIDDNIKISKPDLPNNISLFKEKEYIYIQFNKYKDSKRYTMKNKVSTPNIMNELNNLIDNVNKEFPELKINKYTITNPNIFDTNEHIIKIIESTSTISNKPTMPKNFSICNVNDTDYIQFCKKIDDTRHQYKTRINSYNLQQELNDFIDVLNTKYNFGLVKEEYTINNSKNWKTKNKCVDHTNTNAKISQRERSNKLNAKKREEIGDEAYKEMMRVKAIEYRNKKTQKNIHL